jgi:hypothetical protein
MNYIVVLFKDKRKKRLIKKFITLTKAKNFFSRLKKESDEIIFEKIYEDGRVIDYELGIVEMSSKQLLPVYITDEMGRNVKVKLEDEGMTLFEICKYRKEEKIYDVQKKKKITIPNFISTYLKTDSLKMVFSLNNRVVVQNDDKFYIFTLKNSDESYRLINCLSNHFVGIKRKDCLFVKDTSVAQKKYLYDLLEKNGFDKKMLYRKFTSFPRQ